MDPSLAESMGVNTENLLISYPNSAENVLNVVDTLTKSGALDVIVIDSVSAPYLSTYIPNQKNFKCLMSTYMSEGKMGTFVR